jgi:hypothetical protein
VGALFSPCGRYRYSLTRRWGAGPTVVFVMLNPSTANETQDDPTIARCRNFAAAWDFGALEVVNLFAWRATDPRDLRRASEPAGPDNRRIRDRALRRADRIVLAWGNHGAWQDAGPRLLSELLRRGDGSRLAALGWTKPGHPRHVLYLPRTLCPMPIPARHVAIALGQQ